MFQTTPRSATRTFQCPCGETFETTTYSTVNVTIEPELLYRLLAGTLNVAICASCGRKAASGQPFIYHDMARGLFAYVHPDANLPEDERNELLASLRTVYDDAVAESERLTQPSRGRRGVVKPRVRRHLPHDDALRRIYPDAPPMQVIFGVEDLTALVESLLDSDEKLGRVVLSTKARGEQERLRLLSVATRLAEQAHCLIEVEDLPAEYTVLIYGSRARIRQINAALALLQKR
ncbi:MAG TPA: CpXC domain-containing protein [Ktedonobacterales bacterium]|nr:CpXC domain-containing protein [Ktedonobacterales bacterium]